MPFFTRLSNVLDRLEIYWGIIYHQFLIKLEDRRKI